MLMYMMHMVYSVPFLLCGVFVFLLKTKLYLKVSFRSQLIIFHKEMF